MEMRITILPCVGTDQAVCEIEDGLLPIEIRSPRKLSGGETELILWRLYQDICGYRWMLDHFRHLIPIMPFWALASIVVGYLRFHDLGSIHPAFIVFYGWTTFWLAFDGIWGGIQVGTKIPQWWRDRKAFKSLKEPWTAKVARDEWLAVLEDDRNDVLKIQDKGGIFDRKDIERGWIEHKMDDLNYGHLYARLLKRWPPRAMDFWPVGIWRYLRRMILGVPVRRPWLCYPVEK